MKSVEACRDYFIVRHYRIRYLRKLICWFFVCFFSVVGWLCSLFAFCVLFGSQEVSGNTSYTLVLYPPLNPFLGICLSSFQEKGYWTQISSGSDPLKCERPLIFGLKW